MGRYWASKREVVGVPSISSLIFRPARWVRRRYSQRHFSRSLSPILTKEKYLCAEALVLLFENHGKCALVTFSIQIRACSQVALEVHADTTRRARGLVSHYLVT